MMDTSRRSPGKLSLALAALALALPALLLADAPAGRFTASAGVVTDTVTGLQWEQGASPTALTWAGAASYCQSLTLAGGGWRLPSMKEIQTLVDESAVDPALDATLFSEAEGERFWTSSPQADAQDRAWLFHSSVGSVYTQETDFEVFARCVR